MKGLRRMAIVASSTIAFLACQGCAITGASASAQNIPAPSDVYAPASLGMKVAAPSALNDGPMSRGHPAEATPRPVAGASRKHTFTSTVPSAQMRPESGISVAVTTGPSDLSRPAIDFASSPALQAYQSKIGVAHMTSGIAIENDFSAEVAFSAPKEQTGLHFDVGLAPRLAYQDQGKFQTRRFGGEVRIGENFDERGKNNSATSWYMFAGADGEALCWDLGDKGASLTGVRLRDQVTVGDIQAGISFIRGGGQLSLAYIRREVSYSSIETGSISTDEDFAGVSFTLRR